MFLRLPFDLDVDIQQLALVLNTALLIGVLIVVELVYAEASREKRRDLRLFLPLLLVIIGVMVYAVYKQTGSA
ncbi:MAG TPA: hypothetical protein VD735_07755 [Candidatus Saccharimonadales bacterium]|nr:hypothetical protein [Candidatus Saccharimonadales bacterium]